MGLFTGTCLTSCALRVLRAVRGPAGSDPVELAVEPRYPEFYYFAVGAPRMLRESKVGFVVAKTLVAHA